jgi:hypothetical protein
VTKALYDDLRPLKERVMAVAALPKFEVLTFAVPARVVGVEVATRRLDEGAETGRAFPRAYV